MSPANLDCQAIHATLAPLSADRRVAWAATAFGDELVLLSSMQRTAVVLMHMFHTLGLRNEILFLDTGYHFPETLQMRDETMQRWGLNVVTLYPELSAEAQEAQYGRKLFNFVDGQPECCRLRKEEPLLRHLATKKQPVSATGLRRAEGGRRANVLALSADPRTGGYSFAPLFDWKNEDVEAYIAKNGLPVHPLYERSFRSIGCYPCTTPVAPGEDDRAGRWRHLRKPEAEDAPQYCRINFSDGDGI
jgi:phosphoadenosine phosphosulfate reductase